MPLLKILHYGHPLLREKAFDVKGVSRRERELIADMAETMYKSGGIGLAATQVGVLQRLFIVDIDQEEDRRETRRLQVFINPEIVWESEEDEPFEEGCLSIPGISAEVYRPGRIKLVARDENFEPFELEAGGLLARVIQHENDHLNGVLFVDRLALLRRTEIAGELNKLRRSTLEELHALEAAEYPLVVGNR